MFSSTAVNFGWLVPVHSYRVLGNEGASDPTIGDRRTEGVKTEV